MHDATRRKAWLGWCLYDWANSAFATVILSAVLPVYFVSLVPAEGARFSLFGVTHTMPASALWGYAVSVSMLLVAVSAPFLGAHADRRGARMKWLMFFCLIGTTATALLFWATPGRYLLAAGLFVVANVGFAASNIFYNAFLPALAQGNEVDRLSGDMSVAGWFCWLRF